MRKIRVTEYEYFTITENRKVEKTKKQNYRKRLNVLKIYLAYQKHLQRKNCRSSFSEFCNFYDNENGNANYIYNLMTRLEDNFLLESN